MSMNGNLMGAEISAALDTLSQKDSADTTKVFQTICTAIVAHIQSNAVVNVTSVSGVTTGGGVSGPGTGTIT